MKYLHNEYATKNQWIALGRWFISLMVILGATSFVVICSFAWGYLS